MGGRTMESLVSEGLVDGVLDITTTEWADEICGGVFSAGSTRLEAASAHGVPQRAAACSIAARALAQPLSLLPARCLPPPGRR